MPIAKQLIEEIEGFAQRNPGHPESVAALLAAVRRIDEEFAGIARATLLTRARETFLQQVQILEATARTRDTLQSLQANQKALVNALKELARQGAGDVTLH
jgi:hypothetical protein